MSVDFEGALDPMEGGLPPTFGGGQGLPVSDKNGHLVAIRNSSKETTESGAGSKLVLDLEILDGPHQGENGNWNLNLWHTNAVTVQIAQRHLKCVAYAVGHTNPLANTEPLHDKPFRVVVKPQTKGEGAEKGYTNVTDVLRADGSKLSDPPKGQAQSAPGAAPAPAAPPQQAAPAPQQQPPAANTGFPPQQPQQPQQPPQQVPPQQGQFPVQTNVAPSGPPQQAAPPQQQAAPQTPPPANAAPWQQPPPQ